MAYDDTLIGGLGRIVEADTSRTHKRDRASTMIHIYSASYLRFSHSFQHQVWVHPRSLVLQLVQGRSGRHRKSAPQDLPPRIRAPEDAVRSNSHGQSYCCVSHRFSPEIL